MSQLSMINSVSGVRANIQIASVEIARLSEDTASCSFLPGLIHLSPSEQ